MARKKAAPVPENGFVPVDCWRWRAASNPDGPWHYGEKPPIAVVYVVERLYAKVTPKEG